MREYKVVVLGAGGVGKSSLTVQYVRGVYVETYDPTIEDSYRKSTAVDNRPCTLEILDTAGVEQFTAMRELYIKNGEGFILVYSVTNEESLAELAILRKQIIEVKQNANVPIVLVANKCDLAAERRISPQQGISTAESWGRVPFYETSAKYMSNVNEIFIDLVRQIMRRDSAFSPLSITQSQSSDEQGKSLDLLSAGVPDYVKREAPGHLRASSLNVHHTLSTQKSRLLRSKQTRKGSLASSFASDQKKDKECIIM